MKEHRARARRRILLRGLLKPPSSLFVWRDCFLLSFFWKGYTSRVLRSRHVVHDWKPPWCLVKRNVRSFRPFLPRPGKFGKTRASFHRVLAISPRGAMNFNSRVRAVRISGCKPLFRHVRRAVMRYLGLRFHRNYFVHRHDRSRRDQLIRETSNVF